MKSIRGNLKRNKVMFYEFKIWNGSYRYIAVIIVLSKTVPYMFLQKVSKVFKEGKCLSKGILAGFYEDSLRL